jgi:cation:H+ antiporter
MNYLLLVVGFALLIKGADLFVDGSSSVARLLKVPTVIIGLTIVAFGTSAPEASVSISAGLSGSSDIALGNVIGSNIFNLLIVVGVCAICKPFIPDRAIMRRDFWWCLGSAALTVILMLDSTVGRIDGIILLVAMAAYLVFIVRSALHSRRALTAVSGDLDTEDSTVKQLSPLKSILFIFIGLAAIIIGGNLVVDNAKKIAADLGMSQTLIGVTIVACGTSLPELVTSIVAARKGESGLALGNVVGSNIFNILFILGAASALSPVSVQPELLIDGLIMIVVTAAVFIFCRTKHCMNRIEGILCVAAYIGYTAYAIIR